jgi:NAD(P)-dependent dehydrogenase (short-subunit alcohol dehydrogenase family)
MTLSLFDLTGKVAVITGSSRGIGRAMAETMAEAGAKLVISGRNLEPCQEVVDAIKAKGGEATAITCRISDKAQCDNLVAKAIEAYGRVDIMVCNAAINPHHGPIDDLKDEVFERMMVNNVQSNFWFAKAVKPGMAERKEGSIIFIISVAALHASLELPMYGITKLADFALARNLAAGWGKDGIRVNCIAPGLVVTQFARVLYEDPERRARREAATPLGRLGQPIDIAGPALLLASQAGAFITGQIITVDGGTTIQSR